MIGSAQIILDYEQGRAAMERSIAIALDAGAALGVAYGYANLGSASGEVYQFLHAERDLANGIAYCLEHDMDTARLYMQAWSAITQVHLGHWDAAAGPAMAVLERQGVSAISRIMALVALGRLRARRGDPGVAAALDEALALATQTGHLQRLGPVHAARAEAAWLSGNRRACARRGAGGLELAVSKRHPWLTGELGYWLWRAGEQVELPAWAARPFALQAAGAWRAAAAEWERLGCPYERAMALFDGDHAAKLVAHDLVRAAGRPAGRGAGPATVRQYFAAAARACAAWRAD